MSILGMVQLRLSLTKRPLIPFERYLRKVDSNALTDKGKIKNYKILYSQSEYDFIKGLCIQVIVNDDAKIGRAHV